MSKAPSSGRRLSLRRLIERDHGDPDIFSTAGSFAPPVGRTVRPGSVAGYYIDFSMKTESPRWPPDWLPPREQQLHVATAQWGLGCYERFLHEQREEWLAAARHAADHLIEHQEDDGAWLHRHPMPHTFRIDPPWVSGMAQGEGASLLVRIHRTTGEDRYAEAAVRALAPLDVPTRYGGALATLEGGPFLEEYPTLPPSYVLNGGIFAAWGLHDVGVGLDQGEARNAYEECVDTLTRSIHRFETDYWSRYDLFPHPVVNVASAAYHLLHITQLKAMELVSPRRELTAARERWEECQETPACRRKAFTRKVAFRLIVPRNALLGGRLPWAHNHPPPGQRPADPQEAGVLVLCYHAISENWPAMLSVTPERFESQIELMLERGYQITTLLEAVTSPPAERTLVITFDDAYRSVFEHAYPILARHGVPATVFVPTAFAGKNEPMSWPGIDQWLGTEHESELTCMNWEELSTLAAEGGWEIGSHTRTHPQLTQLSDAALAEELQGSRADCEGHIWRACRSIAFPYGNYDARVVAASRQAGYAAGVTLPPRFHPAAPLRWPRVGIYHGDNDLRFRLKVSPTVRRLRASRPWEGLAWARRTARRVLPAGGIELPLG